jgi:hypothetical protein
MRNLGIHIDKKIGLENVEIEEFAVGRTREESQNRAK